MRDVYIIRHRARPEIKPLVGKLGKSHRLRLQGLGYELEEVVEGRKYSPEIVEQLIELLGIEGQQLFGGK